MSENDEQIVNKIWGHPKTKFYTKSGDWEYLCLANTPYLAAIQSYQAYIAKTDKSGYNDKVLGFYIEVDERGFRMPGAYRVSVSKLEDEDVLDV